MLNKHGCAEGCEGCRYRRTGLDHSRAHIEVCGSRIAEGLAADEEGSKDERIAMGMAADEDEDDKKKADTEEEMGIDGEDDGDRFCYESLGKTVNSTDSLVKNTVF